MYYTPRIEQFGLKRSSHEKPLRWMEDLNFTSTSIVLESYQYNARIIMKFEIMKFEFEQSDAVFGVTGQASMASILNQC